MPGDSARSYLVVPAGGAGEGMGHLVRCLKLSEQLGHRVSFLTNHLDAAARKLLGDMIARRAARPDAARPSILARLPAGKRWDLVVVDARRTSAGELQELMAHGLVACIDEGGEARGLASFILDALPGPPHGTVANQAGFSFLFLPPRRRAQPQKTLKRILLSLGGEDREHLGESLAAAMVKFGVVDPGQLTVVEGPLGGRRAWPSGVNRTQAPRGLVPLILRHDLLITHFGIAAFEALASGTPVILFNPTRYHETLGTVAGFPMIGTGTPRIPVLKSLLADPSRLYAHVAAFNEAAGNERGRKLGRLLGSLKVTGSADCPVCGHAGNAVIARFPDRTYRRCAECGVISLESFAVSPKKYDTGYFSTEYRAQYGRTYLEDFHSIKDASRPRVAIIRSLLRKGPQGVVLDVGCAYGPFLAALTEARLPAVGLDVSPGAVSYVRKQLGIPALCGKFEEVERKRLPRRVMAVTLWYVLEHFTDTDGVLAKASALLAEGGVLAFSTPNGHGVSARRDLRGFLQNSPADHFTIFSPRKLAKILRRYSLVLRWVRITGHHPERFPGVLGAAAARWRTASRVLRLASVALRLGDTFEAYAVKGDA